MMQTDSRLHQSLVKEPERPPSIPPHILPSLVGLEIAASVEKINSVLKKVGHMEGRLSY
jgi:hypothetical protein